jgi:hypothetical protein
MMKQRFPNVKLIENKDSGFPKGNNTGVAIAKGEYIASSILIPLLPKILLQSTGFRRKAKDLGIVVKLIDGAGGFFLKVRESSYAFCRFTK